ncbi:MAG: exopolysaccharide Pel transporter PelG [Lachnospiraceae bacterium]|nr:exopolysaccharide Pel transporter PelG [Lachnospiraceae bacterium]
MAGIGVRLNRIFEKGTITTNLIGFGYSAMVTVAPMIVVIAAVFLMQIFLQFAKLGYAERELYACTVLYIFIFAMLTASPFNAVLSRYMSDVIYNEQYEHIMPCYYVGVALNIGFSALVGIPFFIHEYIVGEVEIFFVFFSYLGFMSLMLVFFSMLFLSITKDYKKISAFFFVGMTITVLLSMFLTYLLGVDVIYSMLVSLDIGFLIIACLELALIRSYFRQNSGDYIDVIKHLFRNWRLVLTNFLYTLGLYVHNFVFWTTPLRMVVRKSFVCVTTYDLATCIAMFTNLSASVIFITRVEMKFHERYKNFSEAVIGGRGMDIRNAKDRMFEQLADELMNLVRLQFIVSVVVYMMCIVFLPRFGFGGLTMQMYPCLAAGYFIMFIMYAAMIFLYYYNDYWGALMMALIFVTVTVICTFYATSLTPIWYGIGLVAGSFAGFCYAYHRLRVMEKKTDIHTFCTGSIMKGGNGKKPSNKVFDRALGIAPKLKEEA